MKRLCGLLISILILGCFMPMPVAAETVCCKVLMELQTGMVLESEAGDMQVPIGSLTKLMTVWVVAEKVAAGSLAADTVVTVSPSAQGVAGATVWLLGGEKMTVQDLLKAVIIGNANDAAVALACCISGNEAAFVQEMNGAAFSLQMRDTRFADCSGLSGENRSTAKDIALLCRALAGVTWLQPLFTTWRDFLRDGATELVSENVLTRKYDGLLGMKAGHGEACGYTLAAAAQRDGMGCIAVILGASDSDSRFAEGKAMLQHGFRDFSVTTPDFSGEFMQPLPVRGGMAQAVGIETGGLRAIAAPNGSKITWIVILPKFLEAPVTAGSRLGEIAFYCEDTLLYESPLTAAENVPRRGFREMLGILLGNMFKRI